MTTTARLTELTAALRPLMTSGEWVNLNANAIFEGWTTAHFCDVMENELIDRKTDGAVLAFRVIELEQMAEAEQVDVTPMGGW